MSSNAYSWACRRNPLVRATYMYWRGRHVVYRQYGNGELLYIGMTSDAYERMKQHRQVTPWWPQVDKLAMKVYPTRRAALDAEAEAIRAERPLYNSRSRLAA